MVLIQEYRDAHKEQIIELILDIQNNEFNIDITIEQQQDLLMIKDFYQKGHGNFWIALIGQKLVGTISLLDISNQQVALRKLFVHKKYRGEKYKTASLLLRAALQWSVAQKVKEIFLGTTAKYHAAHRFYEKSGFTKIEKSDLPTKFPIMEVDTRFYNYLI